VNTLANTTVLSTFAAVSRSDLLRELLGRLYIPSEVYEEVLNGLGEGYDFYNTVEAEIYPLAETGWIEVVSMDDEELRIFPLPAAPDSSWRGSLPGNRPAQALGLPDRRQASTHDGSDAWHHGVRNAGCAGTGGEARLDDGRGRGRASQRDD
jgi:hypothetical protein